MALTLKRYKPPRLQKCDYKYKERPKATCSTYLNDRNPFSPPLTSEFQMENVPPSGDEQLTTKAIDWKGKSRGLFFHHPQGNVNVICVKLSEDCKRPVPVICRERTKTRCTQTRYRESSAQTRPYLPEVAGDKENYKNFEVYQISKLIESYEPPGEYEAKVVERFRRRRQYENALQVLKNAKEKHHTVLEAMEWEDWVAREEYTQNCQMLRMKIVEGMFNKREANLRQMSEKRISFSSERILAKRNLQLSKIKADFDRGVRKLEAKKQQINRNYRKGNITKDHIDPTSDLHAPQMRFGVNPSRRHFVGFRKDFDDRINDLDRQKEKGELPSLTCPFRKLKTWSKPKSRKKEITQRFCSDENLKTIYESLKGLRMVSEAPKVSPTCLKRKAKPVRQQKRVEPQETVYELKFEASRFGLFDNPQIEDTEDESNEDRQELMEESAEEIISDDLCSRTDEEIGAVLGEFEGTTLGNFLQFLSDELERLKLQKKFQAIHMLAQKERWWREACEAGLRQKENYLRVQKEKHFSTVNESRQDRASLFLESVLEKEFNFTPESLAIEKARRMIEEITENDERGTQLIVSGERLAYDRMILSNFVRNQVFAAAEEEFTKMKANKLKEDQLRVIEEVLFASVERALENEFPTSESVVIVGEVLDELIANAVTYDFDIFSPSSSEGEFDTRMEVSEIISKLLKLTIPIPGDEDSFTDKTNLKTKLEAEKETKALIRKLVRRAVPEERWKTEGERIIQQTLSDTFNEAVYEVECLKASQLVRANDRLNEVISEIYHRMGEYSKKDQESSQRSSVTEFSAVLRSVPSCIDFFENYANSISDESSIDFIGHGLREGTNKKLTFIDQDEKEYQPAELHNYDEKLCVLENDALQWQESDGARHFGENTNFSDEPTGSSEEIVALSFPYTDLRQRPVSARFSQAVHPDLLTDHEERATQDCLTENYEKADANYARASVARERRRRSSQIFEESERRSSF